MAEQKLRCPNEHCGKPIRSDVVSPGVEVRCEYCNVIGIYDASKRDLRIRTAGDVLAWRIAGVDVGMT